MRRLIIIALALLTCRNLWADDLPMPLKAGPGEDIVNAYCDTCHTTDYIIMNSTFLSPDGWKAEVTKMRTAFGAPIDDAIATEITAYLAAHYAVTKKP